MNIERTYKEVYDRAALLCRGKAKLSPLTIELADGNSYNFGSYIMNAGRRHSTNKSNRIDIIIWGRETVEPSHLPFPLIASSNIKVAYVNVNSTTNKAEILQYIRYDFDQKHDQTAHPLFHAHICKPFDAIMQARIQKDYKEYEVNGCNEDKLDDTIRIPTAHMSFVSVLTSIVADHFGEDKLIDFIKFVKEKPLPKYIGPIEKPVGKKPKSAYKNADLVKDPMLLSVNGDSGFRCIHWYRECY